MMIDEKKLIEDLEEVFKEHYYRLNKSGLSNELKRFINLQDRVAKVIFDQPKLSLENKTSDKWIPCSERLPKQNERIIGTFYNDEDCLAFVGEATYFPDILDTPYPLIAWMPLPEAYKGLLQEKEK